MKKLLIIALVALSMIIILSSCSYDLCPTYANCSMKSYGPKYTYAHANAPKKVKKNKVW